MAMSEAEVDTPLLSAEAPSGVPYLDNLPVELIELICSWVLAEKRSISRPVSSPRNQYQRRYFTQFSRTLARLSLTSKRYRLIAHPYLYSRISIGGNDGTWLPSFVILLYRKPDLRLLIKEIDVQCFPKGLSVEPDTMGPILDDAASQFSLTPLSSWNPKDCIDGCSREREPCAHYKRIFILLLFLTPNVNRWSMVPPNQYYFTELTEATWQTADTKTASPSDPRALTSLQHLWVPGAQPFPYASNFSAQEIGLQLRGWLVPSLQTLRLRNASIYHSLLPGIKLDNLKEIVIDFGLLTRKGLFSLAAACKVLERFYFYSRGDSPVFPDGFGNSSLHEGPPFEFLPEYIVPAFAHLRRTLRILAINRWDGARGGADHTIDLTPDNEHIYATWPGWKGMGMDKVLGSLKSFKVLETLKLDSTCLYHYDLESNVHPDVPEDHLVKRLPISIQHLVLPGAPPQMIPALHALASSAASKEFPHLRRVEITSDERDTRKREVSMRKYGGLRFLRDTYSRFINIEDWNSLEKKFAAAGVQLVHVDSGNTSCFARDVLENAGLLGPASREPKPRIFVHIV
ncbi:hypothetical protein V8C35DRAFT_18645 [Trichoderma chlorosporum]